MSEARVKAKLWVQMALRMGDIDGRPGAVLRRGDADAGGVIVVLRGRDGLMVLSQVRAGGADVSWLRATGAGAVTQAVADAYVDRQVGRDPDLWVLEFEAPDFTPPFEARLIDYPLVSIDHGKVCQICAGSCCRLATRAGFSSTGGSRLAQVVVLCVHREAGDESRPPPPAALDPQNMNEERLT